MMDRRNFLKLSGGVVLFSFFPKIIEASGTRECGLKWINAATNRPKIGQRCIVVKFGRSYDIKVGTVEEYYKLFCVKKNPKSKILAMKIELDYHYVNNSDKNRTFFRANSCCDIKMKKMIESQWISEETEKVKNSYPSSAVGFHIVDKDNLKTYWIPLGDSCPKSLPTLPKILR